MTTPINTFQDIIDAVRDNPNLRDELRLHLLGEDLLKLPAQFAEFVRVTQEHNDTVNRRLARLEEGQARLEEGQAHLEEGQAHLEEGQARLEKGQAHLEEGQAGLEKGQAHLEEGQAGLEEGQTSLRKDLNALTTEVRTIGGHVSRLTGDEYERQASRIAIRRARTHLGITDARIVGRAAGTEPDPIAHIANIAALGGLITEEEADELERADLVMQGTKDGRQVYVVAEISVTVQAHDAQRALYRAAILQKASDTETDAAAIGQTIAEDATKGTPDRVTLIVIPKEV